MKKRKRMAGLAACVMAVALLGGAGSAYAGESLRDIAYTGAQNEYIVAGSKLFAQVDNGLPGDVFAGTLTITNGSDEPCEVFVTAQDVMTSGPDDLLERIPLRVEKEGDAAFEGTFAEADSAEPISVGVLQVGETMNVDCSAVIPSDLTNEYSDAAVGMNMAVSIEDRPIDGSTGLVQTGTTGSGASGNTTGAGLVHTGDGLLAAPFVLGALVAAGAVIWCAWKRRLRMW